MSWNFSTDPEFDAKLEWMRTFVREEIIPLEVADLSPEAFAAHTDGLKQQVKDQGLWAAHLEPELGGGGFGQLKLGLMHEILGQSVFAPPIFGNNAPDSGNAELLAIGGNDFQKERWMKPLLAGEIRSCFSMTEPGAGADPTRLTTTAVRDGDEYVINGHKWFSSNGSQADFFIVMVVTDPDAEPHRRASMVLVDRDTPGVNVLRNIPVMGHTASAGDKGHAEILYENVRVPASHLIGEEGDGFLLAQKRLGPGRIHHAMRWLGQGKRAFDMMCERVVTREVQGGLLSQKQMVQDMVATSKAELEAARLLTLQAAWKMDQGGTAAALTDIAIIKFWGAQVLYNVIDEMYRNARAARIYDGPDEVHKVTVARRVLRDYEPSPVPTEHIPTRTEAAQRKFAAQLEAAS
jgi:acyl-CoA dehydrogenase